MSFDKKTMAAGFILAFLLVSFCAEAIITVPCPLIRTMDCMTDSACKTCCIDNGYADGECNGYVWACVCTKKPVVPQLGRRGMETFN
ncbi:unnamed protein product [Urochloa humidicola]